MDYIRGRAVISSIMVGYHRYQQVTGVKPYIGKMRAELYITAYELKETDGLKQSNE